MKKELRKRKNEQLYEWVERLAPMMVGKTAGEIKEVMTEVSKTSYIEGTRAAMKSVCTRL